MAVGLKGSGDAMELLRLILLAAIIGCFLVGALTTMAVSPPIKTERVANGLSNPLFVTHVPGVYDRIFIVEQCGLIKILTGGSVLPTPFLNISSKTTCGGEQGLLGLAFHPDYASNGQFFVDYTDLSGTTTIAGYTVSVDPNVANTSEKKVLAISQPYANHNGGWIAFGADGYLYIGTGDGGNRNDPENRAQNITGQLLGKLLRIDVNGDDFPADAARNYAVPSTNPFVGVIGDDEIWAYGLRNPWRNSFDRLTHDLYLADVGQKAVEEIDFQPASSAGGENYGWRCMEGDTCTGLTGCTCDSLSLVPPIHTYTHNGLNCSITGGYVYRGCAISGIGGVYFFADYCSNSIWSFRFDGVNQTEFTDRTAELTPDIGTLSSITSFGEDAYGEIYICDQEGEVFKISPADTPPDCNNNLLADGCDIARGTSQDVNLDGIPDECVAPPAPAADPSGWNKSRVVSFGTPAAATATGVGSPTALRVTLTSLHHPNPPYTGGLTADFSAFEGQIRWVGPPSAHVESTSDPTPFVAAALQCAPYYHDWPLLGPVHVIGREIVPSSTYTVERLSVVCLGNEKNCTLVSASLGLATTRWGDIDDAFNPPATSTQPDMSDISALANKFKNTPGAPNKVRAALVGDVPDLGSDIGLAQIAACVDAFKGQPFPYAGPVTCP
ncbi:MAG: PQQ-dependent sugar dehydrogenase [Phycisphaerales bacterium]|nr:PQQ-dependent sugar dehydrogenase [Phycisphaerales bacterium]